VKKALTLLAKILGGLVALVVVVSAALFVITSGPPPVPATVADDPSIPHVTLDGVTFHAEAFGDPANPVVVVVHGGPGADYRQLLNLQELSDDYYVVFYDQRGTGLSPRVDPAELTVASSVEDLDRIVTHYGNGDPVNIVGHSWGGMLATAYAGRYPDRVNRLVVAEPGILTNAAYADYQSHFSEPIDLPFMLRATRLWFESLHVRGPDDQARTDFFQGNLSTMWWFSPKNGYNCPGATLPADHSWRAGAAAGSAILESARDENGEMDLSVLTDGLENYTRPTLMIVSACNEWIGLAHQQAHHLDLYPDVQVVVIPDAGHDMFWENPAESVAAVRAFLEE
jgi:proline iminopeptidase